MDLEEAELLLQLCSSDQLVVSQYLLENPVYSALFVDTLLGRTKWVDQFFQERPTKGEFARLYPDLCNDEVKFYKYFRMKQSTFAFIVSEIDQPLTKVSKFRECLSVEERLMITIRYDDNMLISCEQ